jgi:hypothetical protein
MTAPTRVRTWMGKRAYGTGSLRQLHGAWYGRWYVDGHA